MAGEVNLFLIHNNLKKIYEGTLQIQPGLPHGDDRWGSVPHNKNAHLFLWVVAEGYKTITIAVSWLRAVNWCSRSIWAVIYDTAIPG